MSADAPTPETDDQPDDQSTSETLPLPSQVDYSPTKKSAQKLFPGVRLVGHGPAEIASELSRDADRSMIGQRTVDLDLDLAIDHYERFATLLPDRLSSGNARVILRKAVDQTDTRADVHPTAITDDWEFQFTAATHEWRLIAWAHCYQRGPGSKRSPKRAVKTLKRFVASGITDDAARLALIGLCDEYDVDVSLNRDRILSPVSDADQ